MTVPAPVRGARAAVVFLTRVPIGGFPYAAREMQWAAAWFPLVGLGVGAVLAAVWTLLGAFDPLPAAALTLGVGLLLTGALHEDGLADTADALGGANDRESLFRILKDSRIGTYGAVTLIVALTTRMGLLAGLGDRGAIALITAQCVSRLPAVWLLATLPYATPEHLAKSGAVRRAALPQALLASFIVIGVLVGLASSNLLSLNRLLAAVAALGVITVASGAVFQKKAGGVTGDFLGSTQQIAEIAIFMIFAAGPSLP